MSRANLEALSVGFMNYSYSLKHDYPQETHKMSDALLLNNPDDFSMGAVAFKTVYVYR